MIFERIESKGLSHFSYLISDEDQVVIIDPRRDCDIYIQKSTQIGTQITHILETHRNEDYLIGSKELASRTNAQIWHADNHLDYQYGQGVEEGQKWKIGKLKLEAIHTPGHTPGSMSYLLRDPNGNPWIIFCGDTLFAGDVGRVDLMGIEKAKEMAGMLYDSVFNKILPLGDDIFVCPAHGAGSVCGSSIAPRTWTTIGLERKLNPKLQAADKDSFVSLVAQKLEQPLYFKYMEKWNVQGPPLLGIRPSPSPLSPPEFSEKKKENQVVDTRTELSFSSAYVPGSLSLWEGGIASFAGWFLSYDRPILLVNETNNPSEQVRLLVRMGFDRISGFLSGGMHSWLSQGMTSERVDTLIVQEFCHMLDQGDKAWILDVRSQEELDQAGQIPGANHIRLTQLPQHMSEVPKDQRVYIFCGSGLRSMVAASLLKRLGWDQLCVILGGFAGWISTTCSIQREEKGPSNKKEEE